MFTSITWEIFFTTILLVVGGYYGISSVLLYHNEIVQWIKSQTGLYKTLDLQNPAPPIYSDSIMGDINRDESQNSLRTSTVTSEDVNIELSDDEPEIIKTPTQVGNDGLLIGSVADLVEEIKILIQLISESKSNKVETQSLFHALLIKYHHLLATSYQETINLYICEAGKNQFPFELTVMEVNAWWKQESSPSK